LLIPLHATEARIRARESLNLQLNMVAILVSLIALLLLLRVGWWFALFVPNLYAFAMWIGVFTTVRKPQ